jgi:AcrR family transcriptional regulator
MATSDKPLRADARRNRERILNAARECFGCDGTNAQIDDVASRAGVGVGTVYRHFATKDALVEALAADYFDEQTRLVREALTLEDPWDAFSGYIRKGAELLADYRALAQVAADRPALMQDAAQAADREHGFFGLLEALLTRAQAAGVLRRDVQLEDVPTIMCSLGALQISPGGYANWPRLLALILDGLHTQDCGALPPLAARLSRD